jgi:hypothetical protein
MSLLIAVINHGLNTKALRLKAQLQTTAAAIAIDSGSALTAQEREQFDLALPNVYYRGLLAAAVGAAEQGRHRDVWIWASDVGTPDPAAIVRAGLEVLAHPTTATYAPSADYSPHAQMRPRGDGSVRPATFADGFCFATRTELLARVCRESEGNALGYGIDIHLGLLALRAGRRTWIDHRYAVCHPRSTGYSNHAAKQAWRVWKQRMSLPEQIFHRLAYQRPFKHDLGTRTLLAVPW